MSDDTVPPLSQTKQAVLLIHGIGEQRPMSTLWRLVDLVWTHAPGRRPELERKVYSEPDEISGVFELRRLSTNANADGKRTDFFEYYWAHLMSGNELADVLGWLSDLAMRPRSRVPPTLRKAWFALRVMLVVLGAFLFMMVMSVFASGIAGLDGTIWVVMLALIVLVGIVAYLDKAFISPVLGDAARYLRPDPKNIACRQDIRARGVQILSDLHRSGKYDRIVVVGHSLGGVIAYEIVCHFWASRNRMMGIDGGLQAALREAENAGLALVADPQNKAARDRWYSAQGAMAMHLAEAQDSRGAPLWLVTDLVTMGCPLTHAETLLAADPADFAMMKERRELATNPPFYEDFAGDVQRFSYCRTPGGADDPAAAPRCPHNAAAFSAVRWTNLYFPMQGIMRGDLIGGPMTEVFGPGIADVPVRAPREGGWLPHMDYFNAESGPNWGDPEWRDHRDALREAMALERSVPIRGLRQGSTAGTGEAP
jgi:pimeloyl-ACP methyl ester carboxylesterase